MVVENTSHWKILFTFINSGFLVLENTVKLDNNQKGCVRPICLSNVYTQKEAGLKNIVLKWSSLLPSLSVCSYYFLKKKPSIKIVPAPLSQA